ncbi:hypothetical protein DICPUDRAFT_78843 [Dictyostelium purpureum]|uniref:Profilin n=1 Tax=Dictyostelium purpureum TaxID=5786 RepID=F0ZKR2_DICPU|nr:uncharacterized protein DICPUDRAFT_78843 [Dictyostelium purpureum]EGC35454.1 hypothetical protein DICPUDRAFT_78843 [Dictyostelium purpureum]|eukprot:XP_003287997.1 hypothetical protein DICPUDRAFT_78843 [Dictyostelium purpureum]
MSIINNKNKNDLSVSKDNIETFNEILKELQKSGFKSMICNLDDEVVYCGSDDCEMIKFNEIVEIKNIFNGSNPLGFFIGGQRYFLKLSDDYTIRGSGCSGITENIIIERTNNNKCFISIYDAINTSINDAEEKFQLILKYYFKNNKDEIISNNYK